MAIWQKGSAENNSVRSAVTLLLRVAVSAGLLYFAFRHVDWKVLDAHLHDLRPVWVIAAFLVLVLQAVLGALRWGQLARFCGIPLSLGLAVRYCLIAGFLNQALPSTVGGDVVRVWLVARKKPGWANAAYSVLVDRSLGGMAVALLVVIVSPWTFDFIRDPVVRTTLLLAGLGFSAAFGGILLVGLLPSRWLQLWKPARHSEAVTAIVARLARDRAGLAVAVNCFVIHLLGVLAVWCLAQSVMARLSSYEAVALVPVVLLVAMMPVSIAGWGLRESAMAAILAFAGVGHSVGVLISILYGACLFVLGLVGGGVWALGRLEDATPVTFNQSLTGLAERK
jgi:uncharacterized membrane protein YbhN (UPF0104 family)